ncbi:MAG: AAA family ATPase [Desulfurococcaceae archaeon]
MISEDLQELIQLIKRFRIELVKPFVGREDEGLAITLALMTSEHIVLIGEPGTAKSALARRAADLLKARFFKYLLTRFTEPDELFGPLDISALKNGRYVRITKGKLPEAEIAFLDEIFNASSAILNTLLTLLNERVIYDGYNEIAVPLWALVSASNSVPEELEYQALYDRFLLRHFVKPVSEDRWMDLINASWLIEKDGYRACTPLLTIEDLKTINSLLLSVDISNIKPLLIKLYAVLEDQGIHLTDRRKGKILKVIAAHSFLNGRLTANEEDLSVLKYVAPRDRAEAEKIHIILIEELETRDKLLNELQDIVSNIREVKTLLGKLQDFDPKLLEYLRGFERARNKINKIVESTTDEDVKKKAIDTLSELNNIVDEIKRRLLI